VTASVADQLRERGYAEVACAWSDQSLAEAAEAFLSFFDLPAAEKALWAHAYRLTPDARPTQVGYVERGGSDADDKEYFHYSRVFEDVFAERLAAPDLHPRMAGLRAAGQRLYAETLACLEDVLSELGRDQPALTARYLTKDRPPRVTLRFVSYRDRDNGQPLAAGHYDRSAFTIAHGESGPGLRAGWTDADIAPITRTTHRALFFAGVHQDDYRPLWHDVVRHPSTSARPGTARWALVAFVNAWDNRRIASAAETNTPRDWR
jgi:isopenicillin N synthase-like dioxygenase